LAKGYIVHGIKRRSSLLNTERIDYLYRDRHDADVRLFLHYGDMTDSANLLRLLGQALQQFHAIHAWHPEIGDHDAGRPGCDFLQPFQSIFGRLCPVAPR
jgi:hypothetical protein